MCSLEVFLVASVGGLFVLRYNGDQGLSAELPGRLGFYGPPEACLGKTFLLLFLIGGGPSAPKALLVTPRCLLLTYSYFILHCKCSLLLWSATNCVSPPPPLLNVMSD